jgi:hypothetical protein
MLLLTSNENSHAGPDGGEEDQHKFVQEKLIQLIAETYSHASAYDNVIIVAGFAGFFALWGGTAEDIERFPRLVTVALMAAALLLYVTWHMLQMLTRQRFEHKRSEAFTLVEDSAAFNARVVELDRRQGVAFQKILRLWPFIFVPSLCFGFSAGGLLGYSALAAAFGWPQLTGRW